MSDTRTDLPSVSAPNFTQRVRETIQTYLGRQGDPMDRGLTLRDLIDNGIVKLSDGYTLRTGSTAGLPLSPGDNLQTDPDLTPPPQPTGLTATAGLTNVIVEHDPALFTVGHGYLRTHLYGVTYSGGALPTFADAVELAQFTGTIYSLPSDLGLEWHLWAKWETADGVISSTPAGGTNGVVATTGKIGTNDLGPLVVTAAKIASGAIDAGKIASGAIDTTKFSAGLEPITIVAGSVVPTVKSTTTIFLSGTSKLYRWNGTAYVTTTPTTDLTGTISSAQLADGAVTTLKLASGLEPVTIVSSVPGTKSTSTIFNTTDGKLYRWSGSAYVATTPTSDLTGTITTTQITDNAITTAKIAANAVTASQIAADTITAGQIAAGAITSSELAAGAVVAGKIAAGTIQAADIAASTITGDRLAANTITAGQIASGTITATQIAAGAIGATQIAANAIAAGTAAIQDGAIVNAMIADATIDNAKIASLAVSKLTAGNMQVGAYVRSTSYVAGTSGFSINADGSAELNNIVARGTIYASAGTFAGSLSAATGTFAGSLSAATGSFAGSLSAASGTFSGSVNTGAYTGYAWPAAGNYGSHLSASGLLIGNANNGTYFQATNTGNIYAPQFSIVNGAATFAGTLSAAAGTFSGSLTASAVNAVNTINVSGGAITESYIATGTSSASYTVTVPAGQTWQITAIAFAAGTASGTVASGGITTTFTNTLTLSYAGGAVATATIASVTVPNGTSGSSSGSTTTFYTAAYSNTSFTVTVSGQVSANANTTSTRLLILATKR